MTAVLEAREITKTFAGITALSSVSLEVQEGDDDYWLALPDEDPRAQAYDIYQWLGWLQETLVDALTS